MAGNADRMRADYVIVGGGSAGLVLANRLTEDGTASVILVEAGGEARSFMVQLPAGFAKLVGDPRWDWWYNQAPDPSINGRQLPWSAGKFLGGGSSLNGQVYIRGTRRDYDYWAESGATGWGFEDVLPYFRKLEGWQGEPDGIHGCSGPLSVTPMQEIHPFCRPFLEACGEAGLPVLPSCDDDKAEGAFLTNVSQKDGWRCSTEKAYLRPARQRQNLKVITKAEVERIRTKDGRAVGIRFRQGNETVEVDAKREVIVSAGTLGSPALLMRSGIGDGAYLKRAGVEIVHELREVGRNLQEHTNIRISKRINRPTLNGELGTPKMGLHALHFAWNRKGPLSLPIVQAMALAKARDGLDEPSVQLHFVPYCFDAAPKTRQITKDRAITIAATLCRPQSRGHVALGEKGRPLAVHNFYSDTRDIENLTDGCLLIERIFRSAAFAKLVTGDRRPAPTPDTREEWADFLRGNSNGAHHHAGTCRMGTDDDAVVDPQLRLRGLEGLRVVDASIMPRITSTNTNATTIMIAEKAADIIRKRYFF